eukprot:1405987-Rhodomonas_salina.1
MALAKPVAIQEGGLVSPSNLRGLTHTHSPTAPASPAPSRSCLPRSSSLEVTERGWAHGAHRVELRAGGARP